MTDRNKQIEFFLKECGWQNAIRTPLKQDASNRKYERLIKDEETAILMDAPPEHEKIEPFVNIDGYLIRRDLSAPEIYFKDIDNGFLLLEDLGNDSYTSILKQDQSKEEELYLAAIDVLVHLHRSSLPTKMPAYDDKLLHDESRLLVDWFLPAVIGDNAKASADYLSIWEDLYTLTKISDDVVVLRDYHSDNLMWLPDREGIKKVGLLDFQDAVIGSPVYDLVSLLDDARRDVSRKTVDVMVKKYIETRKSIDKDKFYAAMAVMTAQRNCKIIGIFARLAIRDGKEKYLDYLPRVWEHLDRSLEHPALADLSKWFSNNLASRNRIIDISKKRAIL